jgi:3-deoxy-D-manno-octulosonic-acid transferase
MKRITLLLYNLLFVPVLLILLPGYTFRNWRRGGYGTKLKQRFGILDRETLARIGKGRIWLHTVSVGEVGIGLRFAKAYHERHPGSRFLISSTTPTGLKILQQEASDWLEPMANPVDFPILTSLLVTALAPTALLMVEADIWPNRLAACTALGIPTALLNARLSSRSESRFCRFKTITSSFFNDLRLITLSEVEDKARWLSMGVRPELLEVTGNMKYDQHSDPRIPNLSIPRETGWNSEDPILLAASTHAREEAEVASVFLSLRAKNPTLRLVIAPRHVERRKEILGELRGLGLSCSLRSEGFTAPSDVLLLDTTGELSGWYPLATVVFVGKSLPCSVNHGGQNMIEPMQAGCAVITGPHTGNFEPLATRLCDAGALLRSGNAVTMGAQIGELLSDEGLREKMILAAGSLLEPSLGATNRNCQLVESLLGRPLPEKPSSK